MLFGTTKGQIEGFVLAQVSLSSKQWLLAAN